MFPIAHHWWVQILFLINIWFLIAAIHHLYFITFPVRAMKRAHRSDPNRLRRYLERVVATPSLVGDAQKLVARDALVSIYLVAGRHDEAIAFCRTNLSTLAKLPKTANFAALEANIRRRMTDCLEAVGQTEEAEKQRHLADTALEMAKGDTLRYLTQGTVLERKNRYVEACDAFEKALSVTPPSNRLARIECMLHLALACENAGKPAECLRWAEETMANGAEGAHLRNAHRLASLSYGRLSRLEESETHGKKALEIAVAMGDKPETGQILGGLADIQRKRGKLVEANEACLKAVAVHPEAIQITLAIQAYIYREWGRYDEAIDTLRRHGQERRPIAIPALERRLQAVCFLDMARIEAECGKAQSARIHIGQAVAELKTDAKLGLKCKAAESWVFAVEGNSDVSQAIADKTKALLLAFENDPSTCRGVLFDLGMAAWTRGDHRDSDDCWTRYLSLGPDPVYCPTALYIRGDSRRQLGEAATARDDFRAAVATGIDSHFARLAKRSLMEMPAI